MVQPTPGFQSQTGAPETQAQNLQASGMSSRYCVSAKCKNNTCSDGDRNELQDGWITKHNITPLK